VCFFSPFAAAAASACFVVRMYLIAEFDCSSQAMVGISSGMSRGVLSGDGYESWKFFV
jgi:uncharacterized membrane protein